MARPFNVGLPVAAQWMPPHRVALLNAIAGGESSGRYDVRYTPKGGTKFRGFDKHPGIKEPGPHGPSSAAGRYQFLESTWNDLGGGTFTPERQDAMAWKLATRDYGSRTGRDLDADLQNEGLSPRITEALSPTWHALKANRPRHQKTYAQTLGELLGGEATITPAAGSAGSDEMETDMAIRTGAPGGFSGGYGAANELEQAGRPSSASPPLAKPLYKPAPRSELLAEVLENMKEEAKRPNPRSLAETGLRALNQGMHGYFKGQQLREADAEDQRQRDMMADLLSGNNPQAAKLLQSGMGNVGDWQKAILNQSFKEPKEPDSFTLSPGQTRYRGDQEVASAPDRPEKPSAREQQVHMLTETGVPDDVAKGIAAGRFATSRHPISGVAQVVDKASGQIVFDGNAQAGTAADPQHEPDGAVPEGAVPGAEQGAPSYIPENVDPAQATGGSGFVGGIVNQISDLFGQGLPFPEIEEASEALNTTQVLTTTLLQAEVPGRPSRYLLEKLENLTVKPKDLLRADERARVRLQQTRDLIKTEVDRVERDVLSRPGEFKPGEITKARLNSSQLNNLLKAYDTLLGTMGRRRDEGRPSLDQFDRRR